MTVRITEVDLLRSSPELIVYFSDQTMAVFTAEQLLAFTPNRKRVVEKRDGKRPPKPSEPLRKQT